MVTTPAAIRSASAPTAPGSTTTPASTAAAPTTRTPAARTAPATASTPTTTRTSGRATTPAATPTTRTRARRPAAAPPQAARIPLLAPWADSTKWDEITIAGVTFTGKVTVSGTGMKTKSHSRSPRGRNGGRTAQAGHDLVEFSVTLAAFPDEDGGNTQVDQLDAILARLTDESPTRQGTTAYPVSYPTLAAMKITQVTVESIDIPEYEAGSTLNCTFKFKQWRPSAPRTTRTTTSARDDNTSSEVDTTVRNDGSTIRPIPAPPSRSGAANPR